MYKPLVMKMKIFLAEDDDSDYQLFANALAETLPEFSMHRVTDGLDCLFELKQGEVPDVIFLDLNMPLKSGIDCLKAIGNISDLSDVPVIIYSVSHNIKDIDAAYKLGAAYYLVKPATHQATVQMLKHLFRLLKQPKINYVLKSDFVIRDVMQRVLN
jgi:CheY-like chemotaxis protein